MYIRMTVVSNMLTIIILFKITNLPKHQIFGQTGSTCCNIDALSIMIFFKLDMSPLIEIVTLKGAELSSVRWKSS